MSLTVNQETALRVLSKIGEPCGVHRILALSNGAFESKALMKQVLAQLVLAGMVKHQSNRLYKLTFFKMLADKAKPKINKSGKTAKSKVMKMKDEPGEAISVLQDPALTAIDELTIKLSKPRQVIEHQTLKCEVLERLAGLLSDDVAKVLISIKADLNAATAD